jgi:hypothetical protein
LIGPASAWNEDEPAAALRSESEFMAADQWTVYPNPSAGDELNIRAQQGDDTSVRLRVIDATGRVVAAAQRVVSAGQTITMDFAQALPSGMYFVEILANEEVSTHRLVVQSR